MQETHSPCFTTCLCWKKAKKKTIEADLVFAPTLACWKLCSGFAVTPLLSGLIPAGLTPKPHHDQQHIWLRYVGPFACDWHGLSTTDLLLCFHYTKFSPV